MKKTFILCMLSCMLCACNTMHGLRVHKEGPAGKQQINGGLYYNDQQAVGHADQVKHKVIDKTHAQIEIPVQYQENMAALPKQLPGELKKALKEYDLKSVGKCSYPASLTKQALTLNLNYEQLECPGAWMAFLLWPLLPVSVPVYIYGCTGVELGEKGDFSITNPFESLNEKNLGVRITYQAEPKDLVLSCNRKSCEVQDKQGNPVNKISIVKKMSVDQKRIKQLLDAEAAAAAKRKRQKEEQAKEEARIRQEGEIICPKLYDEMWDNGADSLKYRRSDVIAVSRWTKKWQAYDCNSWLQRQVPY